MTFEEAVSNDLSAVSVDVLEPPSPVGGVQIKSAGGDTVQVTFVTGGAPSPVTSVHGRTGAVVAQCSDYAACYAPIGGEGPTLPDTGPEYHPEISVLLAADGTPALQELPTAGRTYKTLIIIVIDVGGVMERQEWIINVGAADPSDGGQIAPLDYSATINNVHFAKVG